MDIGILYICTGKYKIFWKKFYESSEEKFLTNHKKHYFVFTDADDLDYGHNVTVIKESPKGFPMDSLLRFKMFNSISDKLENFDYLFFFNSNMFFVEKIGNEFLPMESENGLMGVLHPGYFNTNSKYYPFDRNQKSRAFIKFEKSKKYNYFMGGVNGGVTKNYLNFIKIMDNDVDYNIANHMIPIYHDETHLNSFYNNINVKVLDSSYGLPEDSMLKIKPKIVILNKIKHGGGYFDKLPKNNFVARLKVKIRSLKNSLIWKFLK